MAASTAGVRLKEYLDQNGIKYSFVCEKANILAPIMSTILSGNRDIKLMEYYRICKVLKVPFETFLEESDDSEE